MCPSMADHRDSYPKKPQKISSEVTANHANPSKFLHHFLYKAIIVTIFLVILPLLPSQAPEFISQNIHSRSWELLQIIFVGIAVSYGLFSKRSNDETDNEQYSKYDNAQSNVSALLQVSSVFYDEAENTFLSDDNKVRTWNSQYYRGEPVIMVTKESPAHRRQNVTGSQIDEKPLLLPIRSLKSRVSEPNEKETIPESSAKAASISRSVSNLGSKRFEGNSRKSRNGELGGASPPNLGENKEDNVVHRSPIPWRSRSGRMEMNQEDEEGLLSYSLHPPMEDSELNRFESPSFRSQSLRSPKPNSASSSPNKPSPLTPSSPKNQSPLPYLLSESQAKSVEDVVRRKVYRKSSPPPAPPPPPPPPPFLHKSPPMKSNPVMPNNKEIPQKELRRSIRSVPNDFRETENEGLHRRANSGSEIRPRMQGEVPALGKSVRTTRQSEANIRPMKAWEFDEEITHVKPREVEAAFIEKRGFADKLMHEGAPTFKKRTFMEFPQEEEKGYIEPVHVETESEDDYMNGDLGSSGNEEPANDNATDEGPDVDKKADEFIAKFREQIRLQRIQSIRRSAERHARNHSR